MARELSLTYVNEDWLWQAPSWQLYPSCSWHLSSSSTNSFFLNWERENNWTTKPYLFYLRICMLKQAPNVGWFPHTWHEGLGWAALVLKVSCHAKFSSNTNQTHLKVCRITCRCVWLEMKLNSAGQLTSSARAAHPAPNSHMLCLAWNVQSFQLINYSNFKMILTCINISFRLCWNTWKAHLNCNISIHWIHTDRY